MFNITERLCAILFNNLPSALPTKNPDGDERGGCGGLGGGGEYLTVVVAGEIGGFRPL